jgi:hypothetical protein
MNSADTQITFYDLYTRRSVQVPLKDLARTKYERTTAAGNSQTRYAFRGKFEGRNLTKYIGQADFYKPFEIPIAKYARRGIDILIHELAIAPQRMQTMDAWDFENVVAELLRRLGYEVELTRKSKDGGVDIYASREELGIRVCYYVQCKRYKPPNKVGEPAVRELYGIVCARPATGGIMVTSSFFTGGAKKFQRLVETRLGLQDYDGVKRWIQDTSYVPGMPLGIQLASYLPPIV